MRPKASQEPASASSYSHVVSFRTIFLKVKDGAEFTIEAQCTNRLGLKSKKMKYTYVKQTTKFSVDIKGPTEVYSNNKVCLKLEANMCGKRSDSAEDFSVMDAIAFPPLWCLLLC